MDPGVVLAIYGAALSTALALLEIRRRRVVLKFVLEHEYPDSTPEDQARGDMGIAYLKLRVINKSSQPIEIDSIGLYYHPDFRRIRAEDLPKVVPRQSECTTQDGRTALGCRGSCERRRSQRPPTG